MVSCPPAPPAHDDLDALLLAFEPLPADALAAETTHETTEDTTIPELAIAKPSGPTIAAERSSADLRGARRARYRARSRNELLYLREIVAELELELRRWKAQVRGGGRVAVKPSAQAKVWKALAAKQKLSRQEAEVENVRLRVLLDNQIRFAAQLQHLVRLQDARRGPPASPRMFRVKIDAADAEVLETYLGEMEALYAQTDAIMGETGMNLRPDAANRFVRMRNADTGRLKHSLSGDAGSCVEFLDTSVVNSDLETSRTTTWRLVMQHYLQHSGSVYKPRIETPDVLTIKFQYATTWLGRESCITITLSVRTYDEPNRQVNVYRVLSVGDGALAGIATDETGWSVLTPSSSSPNHTVSRSVTRITAMRFHSLKAHTPEETPPQLLDFAKILADFSDEDLNAMIPKFQNLPHQFQVAS